jgi:hypothetical protein
MEIRAGTHAYAVLTPLFTEGGPMPAVYVRLELAANGFAGSMDQLALEHAELERFLIDLEHLEREHLERERRGAATLTSMSPHEFDLAIRVYDRAGHAVLTSELMRHLYVANTWRDHRVALGFEVDPTDLPRILGDFQELLAFRHPVSWAFPER